MPNLELQNAIRSAGLSHEEFADIVQVDVKTVQRWLAGRTPYPRHRTSVAAALDTAEHALWPDTVAPPPTPSEQAQAPEVVTTDDLSGYGRATDPGAPDPLDVLRAAVDAIEIVIAADATESSLVDVLRERAVGGCRVRMIVEDPDDRLEELLGVDGIEICASPGEEEHLIYRADDQLLLPATEQPTSSTPAPQTETPGPFSPSAPRRWPRRAG